MLADRLAERFRRLRRGAGPRPPLRVRLYVKEPCGLCDEARALLQPLEQRGRIAVELVDISADPRLFRRFWFSIPVLELEDGRQLAWPFGRAELARVFRPAP